MNIARCIPVTLFLAMAAPAVALASPPIDTHRPFDQYSWVTTHNAFTSNGLIPNQDRTIDAQLAHGVRGLMLDLHMSQGRVRLCHNTCNSYGSVAFADLINDTLLPFLAREPTAIVSLQLEDFTSADELMAELARAPALAGLTFDPFAWHTKGWPTYQQLLDRGQRVLIFSLNEDNTGSFPIGDSAVHIMATSEYTVENYWSLGTTIFQHEYACVSRWGEDEKPLARRAIAGKPGWRPLFTMNQFHGVPTSSHAAADNRFEALTSRYEDHCLPVAKRKPNYVAVDFHQIGDAAKFADWLTLTAPDGP